MLWTEGVYFKIVKRLKRQPKWYQIIILGEYNDATLVSGNTNKQNTASNDNFFVLLR